MTMRPHVDAALELRIRDACREAGVRVAEWQVQIMREELQRSLGEIEPDASDVYLSMPRENA